MKKMHILNIRGKRKEWGFEVLVDPKYVPEWREDGLDINEIVNTVPQWYADLGLPIGVWCFVQDILNLKNPFSE